MPDAVDVGFKERVPTQGVAAPGISLEDSGKLPVSGVTTQDTSIASGI
jgi:hypothetical protein